MGGQASGKQLSREPFSPSWSRETPGVRKGGAVQETVSRSVVSNSLQPHDCSPPGSSIHGIL